MIKLNSCLFLLLCLQFLYGQINPIDTLQFNTWFEIPNTRLESVKPDPLPPGYLAAIMSAWAGGTFDHERNRLIVAGGGHGDYAGNELYAFDTESLEWARIWGPTPNHLIPSGGHHETYNDGNPSARHGFFGMAYIPSPFDFLFRVGGGLWQIGNGSNKIWSFSSLSNTWMDLGNTPESYQWVTAVCDPVNNHMFVRGINYITEFYPENNTCKTPYYNGAGWYKSLSAAIVPQRRKIFYIGRGEFSVYNISDSTFFIQTTTGANQIINQAPPGIAYDSINGKLVAWYGGRSIFILNLDNFLWTEMFLGGANPGSQQQNGTFGRFQYITSKNAFIVVNSIYGNVFVFKLDLGGGNTTPPSKPMNLTITD